MQGNIYLIGLPGSGKTTVGRRLAKLLSLNFIDIDNLIEERTGVSISHIFEVEGEEGFRRRESQIFEEASDTHRSVISTGGGIVLKKKNRALMRKSGQVIYLNAPINILWKRLKGCQHRPLLQTDDPKTKVEALLAERGPIYQQVADIVIEVTTDSAGKTAQNILNIMKDERLKL